MGNTARNEFDDLVRRAKGYHVHPLTPGEKAGVLWAEQRLEAAEKVAQIDIVFDGPPSHESGRFVEVENSEGKSINFGEWVHRDDGYWVLRFRAVHDYVMGKEEVGR